MFVCDTLDSVVKVGKDYYPQVFLEECKYVVKEKKIINFVDVELEIELRFSDESNEYDEENT